MFGHARGPRATALPAAFAVAVVLAGCGGGSQSWRSEERCMKPLLPTRQACPEIYEAGSGVAPVSTITGEPYKPYTPDPIEEPRQDPCIGNAGLPCYSVPNPDAPGGVSAVRPQPNP